MPTPSFVITWTFCLLWSVQLYATNATAKAQSIYQQMQAKNEPLPNLPLFIKAYSGYEQLKSEGKCQKNVLAIIDFQLSSNEERLWIIDFGTLTTTHHTLVAHGQGTGQEFAKSFSNTPNSHQSSLGFYITESTYQGKHGLSLKLQGVEKGINHNAYDRAIVMHGAKYVSRDFIKRHGRLGRSYGCPAVPQELHQGIINMLKDKACLFIYYPDRNYHQSSTLLQG